MDTYVARAAVEVLRVRADLAGRGPADAFDRLESKLPSLRGRKFYGTFQFVEGTEVYFACVASAPADDPLAWGLETGTIPGGLYVRRKVPDWEKVVAAGKLPGIFQELVLAHGVDRTRPSIEFYRSREELHLLLPVERRGTAGDPRGGRQSPPRREPAAGLMGARPFPSRGGAA